MHECDVRKRSAVHSFTSIAGKRLAEGVQPGKHSVLQSKFVHESSPIHSIDACSMSLDHDSSHTHHTHKKKR